MKILFAGSDAVKNVAEWFVSKGDEVIYEKGRVDIDYVRAAKPDFLVSYNYPHIIPKEVIDFLKNRAINLHIAYLPWNKGAYPNVWSFLEDTPKGVSVILVDREIDAGDILAQKKVLFNEEKETLKSSYEKLHGEIQNLLKEYWKEIKSEKIRPRKQGCGGSFHNVKEYNNIIVPLIRQKGWGIPIKELKEKYKIWKTSGILK